MLLPMWNFNSDFCWCARDLMMETTIHTWQGLKRLLFSFTLLCLFVALEIESRTLVLSSIPNPAFIFYFETRKHTKSLSGPRWAPTFHPPASAS